MDQDPSARATLARLPQLPDSGLEFCPVCGELEAWCMCEEPARPPEPDDHADATEADAHAGQ